MAFVGGAFNELDFLTNLPILNNDDNRDNIFNTLRGEVGSDNHIDSPDKTVIFKKNQVSNTENIKNYYKDTIYKDSGQMYSDLNPYLKLIKNFSGDNFKAVSILPGDIAYLSKLGVYPINRMWVLRRFNDSTVIPDNLTDWDSGAPYPTSTMIGWIDPAEDQFFGIGFSENWTTIDKRLDEVLVDMINTEFKIDLQKMMPMPSFTQNLLMGFLKNMNLTSEYGLEKIPQGDPAVLQEAATRSTNGSPGYGNKSTMSMKLKTTYEQKFINDIDPGSAMLDLIKNTINMGTRDTKYVFGGHGGNTILTSLRKAANSGEVDDWATFLEEVLTAFLSAIQGVITAIGDSLDTTTTNKKEETKEGKDGNKEETTTTTSGTALLTAGKESINKFSGLLGSLAKGLLASTVGKWRYALISSISVMTGENSTPWHLTLGNPYSPFVSLGNIVVKSVDMKFNNEFSFNDMPTKLDIEIGVELGRNLGAQEIFKMFNNGYMRNYNSSIDTESGGNTNPTNSAGTVATP